MSLRDWDAVDIAMIAVFVGFALLLVAIGVGFVIDMAGGCTK